MNKIKKYFIRIKKRAVSFSMLLYYLFITKRTVVYASDVSSSTLATGTKKLISDVTTWLLIIAPILTVVCIIYFCIRRSAADEMDVKKWNNRIVAAIVSCIGAVVASATLNVIIGYYQ